ncbi:MAG: putative lipid II flippase FtsW [Proteobacteria bacterium]|nr:putative lipid II flippase FtsW [Pseudomonadota bacterium]MDE3208364.1 putative lipid II flippase FtsW [Pseudomonadota bacterium]
MARFNKQEFLQAEYDQALLWVGLILLGFGLVMVYSASIAIADLLTSSMMHSYYFLIHQAIYLVIGFAAGYAAFRIPMKVWQDWSPMIFLFGIGLLVVVLIPHVGREVNGSRRWIPFAVFSLQPSEFMKLFAVLYASDYTVRKASIIESFKRGFFPMLMVMFLIGFLLLREPDFGAFADITAITMAILFLGGVSGLQFAGLIVILFVGFVMLIFTSPYRLERIIGFMHPWQDPFGAGYQLTHALIAFGRGGWFGVGLGASVEKLFYLPEAHTDFLLAVIAEELGFVGVMVIIGLFVWLVMRIFRIGRNAVQLERYYGALVSYGVGVWIGVQAIINMGVNMGLFPTKGLTLPLLSYGGSGIVTNCIALGLVMRVDWENRMTLKGYKL